jgi:hypothetical protein
VRAWYAAVSRLDSPEKSPANCAGLRFGLAGLGRELTEQRPERIGRRCVVALASNPAQIGNETDDYRHLIVGVPQPLGGEAHIRFNALVGLAS